MRAVRTGLLCCVAAVASLPVVQSPIAAQASIRVGVGAAVPTAELGDRAQLGWNALVGIDVAPGSGSWAVGASGLWARHPHESPPAGDRSDVYGALARIAYRFRLENADLEPYLGGMAGLMWRRFGSRTQPGLEATRRGAASGALFGVAFPVGRVSSFAEGWWLAGLGDVGGTQAFGVSVGIRLPVGGGM